MSINHGYFPLNFKILIEWMTRFLRTKAASLLLASFLLFFFFLPHSSLKENLSKQVSNFNFPHFEKLFWLFSKKEGRRKFCMEKIQLLTKMSPNQDGNLEKQSSLLWNLGKLVMGEDGEVLVF